MTGRWAIVVTATVALVAAACTGPVSSEPKPPTTSADAPVTLFLGDSYTEGTELAAADEDARWSTVLAERQGWVEVNAGCTGSGYTRRGGVCDNNYVERLASLSDVDPDIIIVSGGVNDLSATQQLIDTRVRETFAALRETFPEARIYAVNGIYYTGLMTPSLLAHLNESVSHAATQAGGTYLDIGDPLLGHPELMADDGIHPNPTGHALIADLTQSAFERVGAFEPAPSANSRPTT